MHIKQSNTKTNIGVFMKLIVATFTALVLLTGCAPEIGSKEWCEDMKEKPKGDWTVNEATDFAKHCIFEKED